MLSRVIEVSRQRAMRHAASKMLFFTVPIQRKFLLKYIGRARNSCFIALGLARCLRGIGARSISRIYDVASNVSAGGQWLLAIRDASTQSLPGLGSRQETGGLDGRGLGCRRAWPRAATGSLLPISALRGYFATIMPWKLVLLVAAVAAPLLIHRNGRTSGGRLREHDGSEWSRSLCRLSRRH
jgi:hypothetical protein